MKNVCFIDKSMLLSDIFTYVSQSHNTASWLNHCITTGAGKSIVTTMYIVDIIVYSDYLPLCIEIEFDIVIAHLLRSHVMSVNGTWLERKIN